MNSSKIELILIILFLIASTTQAVKDWKDGGVQKAVKWLIVDVIILSIGALLSLGDIEVPKPKIERKDDHSALYLTIDGKYDLEYHISYEPNKKWHKYKKPFRIEKNAIISARAKTLWLQSEMSQQDVFVAENNLIYFGAADKPGKSIKSIVAEYIIQDSDKEGNAGNHYVGYELKKSDFEVTGINLDEENVKLTDFSFSPKHLKEGKNTIKIKYANAEEMDIETQIAVNGDKPKLLKLKAQYIGEEAYADMVLSPTMFIVKGDYEDGTEKELTDFSISPTTLEPGENTINISKGGFSSIIKVIAGDPGMPVSIESESNDNLENANDIDVNVRYTGKLSDEDDVDYCRLRIRNKGKAILYLSHKKIDDDNTFWQVDLFNDIEEDPILTLESSGSNAEKKSAVARIGPGMYYIRVSHYYHSSAEYTLQVIFEEEGDGFEEEPNDELSTLATDISVNTVYTGNQTHSQDIDYYRFSLPKKGKLWVNFSHKKMNDSTSFVPVKCEVNC